MRSIKLLFSPRARRECSAPPFPSLRNMLWIFLSPGDAYEVDEATGDLAVLTSMRWGLAGVCGRFGRRGVASRTPQGVHA